MSMPASAAHPAPAVAATIDHTWLPEWPISGMDADAVDAKLTQMCTEAKTNGFAGICVRPAHVARCAELLAEPSETSAVQLATVVGFPQTKVELNTEKNAPTIGSDYLEHKLTEIKQALADGATELDVVWDVGAFLTGADLGQVQGTVDELTAYKQAAGSVPIKLIVETDLLPAAYLNLAAQLCAKTGMAMIKTSTGYVQGGQGATTQAMEAFKQGLGDAYPSTTGIKASGGIKTQKDALTLLAAGATRLGTSNGLALIFPVSL